jgi:glycosyltransferase involved in cell wall biosynthesis
VQRQSFPHEDYEIIVVDNGPDGAAAKTVKELQRADRPVIRYLREPQIGLLYARHAGARAAQGEVVVYVDDDVIAHPDWLRAILTPFEAHDVACSGGKAIPQWEAELPDWYSQFDPGYLSLLDLGEETRDLTFPICVWGCNMAVRRNVIFDIGGFNPDGIGDRKKIWLRGDGECGLQEKISQCGLRIVYEPRAWLYHRIPPSRLTPEHFYWRFFIQGIQDSYVRVRRIGRRPLLSASLLKHGLYCFWRTGRSYAASLVQTNHRIRLRADAWSWYGRGQHQLRTALSPLLREHVLRPSYL